MTAAAPQRVNFSDFVSPTEELIEEARRGRMFILVDDEDRENEGDLVIPGQFATPDAINFMARFARGLICLAMTRHRVDQLGLPLMAAANGTRHSTAFTVSIEAKEGVTTGISAADRAHTIATAINPEMGREHIVTPGHVFPLLARDGGTLVRAGHTEASVDIARLAGLNPSGVICEIMNDDGTMARMPDLVAFAQHHGLKLGTIVAGDGTADLHDAMRMIDAAGRGVVVVIRDWRLTNMSEQVKRNKDRRVSPPEIRDYGIGAQILADLGVRDMVRLSNNPRPIVGLEGYGLRVVETRPLTRTNKDIA